MSVKKQAIDFVTYILSQVCREESSYQLEVVEDEKGTLILIKVKGEDMGRIIGKGGKNISALRTLISNIAAREDARLAVKVIEIEEDEA
jgi:predicted RNA-binding protein YlqC (UPF0109 family)